VQLDQTGSQFSLYCSESDLIICFSLESKWGCFLLLYLHDNAAMLWYPCTSIVHDMPLLALKLYLVSTQQVSMLDQVFAQIQIARVGFIAIELE
jgi:hypothetical protein